ncbi:uncharacterized protein LOC135986914 [Caloenas nicobarica]|uniref:uncharacterized protein LOC135986914 n=1 Tax=Caloenas nicobarica TaxID=187106 RepID=UPI0032B73DC0
MKFSSTNAFLKGALKSARCTGEQHGRTTRGSGSGQRGQTGQRAVLPPSGAGDGRATAGKTEGTRAKRPPHLQLLTSAELKNIPPLTKKRKKKKSNNKNEASGCAPLREASTRARSLRPPQPGPSPLPRRRRPGRRPKLAPAAVPAAPRKESSPRRRQPGPSPRPEGAERGAPPAAPSPRRPGAAAGAGRGGSPLGPRPRGPSLLPPRPPCPPSPPPRTARAARGSGGEGAFPQSPPPSRGRDGAVPPARPGPAMLREKEEEEEGRRPLAE